MFDFLVFNLYRFIFVPLILVIAKLTKSLLPPKIIFMLDERSTRQRPALLARPIWIHASSGEIEYAKPVIREIKKKYPHIPILVTYFSPSALRLMKDLSDVDAIIPLPWDERKQVKNFLDYANPLAVLFSRTDVWPELAYQVRQRNIFSILFSATLSGNSSRLKGIARPLNRFAFKQLSKIFCVNEEDQRFFHSLDANFNVEVQGDSRFDQVLHRLLNPKPLNQNLKPEASSLRPILVAGSTWPQDEKILFGCLPSWVQNGGILILAPHENSESHLISIEKQLKNLNLSFSRYSKAETNVYDVLIIDCVGILPEIYSWGQLAFVGGSFKDRVHSVMEPLACGLPVLVGPYHENNREALHFALKFISKNLSMVNVVESKETMAQVLLELKALLATSGEEIKNQIAQQVFLQAGISKRIVSELNIPMEL